MKRHDVETEESEEDVDVMVRFRCTTSSVVGDVLRSRRCWKEIRTEDEDADDYDLNWTDVHWVKDNVTGRGGDDHALVNHFPNHYELTRKDLLIKNVSRMRKQLLRARKRKEAEECNFCPTSFVLPNDYSLFKEEFKKCPGKIWIMKPVGRAQGRGIFLITRLSQIAEWRRGPQGTTNDVERYVIQKYVARPYLVGGRKFDLRIYCLVTSYTPLVAWIYREGFCRFSLSRYSGSKQDIDKKYMHLTNNAIQKTADEYGKDGVSDCKWSLTSLKLHIASKHGRDAADRVFLSIQQIIVRSLQSVQNVMIRDTNCFELYGYDVMIDSDLKPWMLEVNASPSLSASGADDYALKARLIDDTIRVLDIESIDQDEERTSVGGFDVIWENGVIPETENVSYLGCTNDRSRALTEIVNRSFLEKKPYFRCR